MKSNDSTSRKGFARFKGFNTLVIMQLKDRLNLSFNADKKAALTKMILFFLLLVGATGIIYLLFYVLNLLGIFGQTGYVPVSMFNVIFYLIITLNILSCIARFTNSLFFSEDNQFLMTYPVNGSTIFLSKLVVFYIVELIKSFSMIVPLFVAYGIVYGFPFYYFPWVFLCFLVIALLPVAIASLLCIPYMLIKMFFKKFQFIQGIAALIGLIAVTVLIFYVVNLLPEDLQIALKWNTVYFPNIVQFTKTVESYLGPLVFLSTMILGYIPNKIDHPSLLPHLTPNNVFALLGIIGACALLFVLSYFAVKPIFFSMASKPFEYKKVYIPHNFVINKNQENNLYESAIVPIYDHELSPSETEAEVKKLNKFLRKLNREEKLFIRRKIDLNRIVKFLRKYSKRKKDEKDTFKIVTLEQFEKDNSFGYIIQTRNEVPSLVLVEKHKGNMMHCYDPNYLGKKNHKYKSFVSSLIKDIVIDIRTPGNILNNYLLFIVTPIAILVLNSVFAAMKQSTSGQLYTILFNGLIITMILCASNVSMASIYSREGMASYLLKTSPTNYMKSLTTKLIIRMVIVAASIVFTMVIYSEKCSLTYVRFDLLFFSFLFIYLGHLLWCAELDYMNPQDRLYAEVGQQQGNVSNSNETTAAILTFLISGLFAFVIYFFCNENPSTAFIKVFFVALVFFIARLALFVLKIIGYGTSRNERTNN